MSLLKEFEEFSLRASVADMAAGIILGAAFGKVVNSLVDDILLPPVGQLLGGVNFVDLFLTLDKSKGEFTTLASAREAGIPLLAYGQCLSTILQFFILAFCVFGLVKFLNRFRRQHTPVAAPPATIKSCPFCCSAIPLRATRCPNCTSAVK